MCRTAHRHCADPCAEQACCPQPAAKAMLQPKLCGNSTQNSPCHFCFRYRINICQSVATSTATVRSKDTLTSRTLINVVYHRTFYSHYGSLIIDGSGLHSRNRKHSGIKMQRYSVDIKKTQSVSEFRQWRHGVTGLVSPGAVTDGVTIFLVIVTPHPLPAFQVIVSQAQDRIYSQRGPCSEKMWGPSLIFPEKNWRLFTALHVMQMRSSDEISVCLSVCLSNACIMTKRKKNLSRFVYYHAKVHSD